MRLRHDTYLALLYLATVVGAGIAARIRTTYHRWRQRLRRSNQAPAADRCLAHFKRDQFRVWCMHDRDHDGDHWVKDTLYELRWQERAASYPATARKEHV